MCFLMFGHKYKIIDAWHGHNLMGGGGTAIEKVCKKCGHFKRSTVPGHINLEKLLSKKIK